ncbi:MAG: YbhB/YbcL family Raf kinase inhibitor-like protein [Methanomicrobiales archaeon HGW-Methanomicrobiales-4]|nr:MAG: YbhB/YbcL family Raf kinase inhibitor-like protein [Methanomicrobiales archaeon HGW-Methanomicrobiales-4]
MKLLFTFSLILVMILLCGCIGQESVPSNQESLSQGMKMSVSQMINGSALPDIYSCSGPGQVPSITWRNPPQGTRSMVLILDDPDAPSPPFTHWIVYNCTPDSGGIPPNQIPISERAGTGFQGFNSQGTRGYTSPCPSPGKKHRYIFTLSAMDNYIAPDYPDRSNIDAAMAGHILEQVQIIALFGR